MKAIRNRHAGCCPLRWHDYGRCQRKERPNRVKARCGVAAMGGMLLKDITLTDAQKEQVKTIREKYSRSSSSSGNQLRLSVVRRTRRPGAR